MQCPYCSNLDMPTVGLVEGNGWECRRCGHVVPDIASFKLAGNFGAVPVCRCAGCLTTQQKADPMPRRSKLNLCVTTEPKVPTITVELTSKWNNLYVIFPGDDDEARIVPLDKLDALCRKGETACGDHIFNPTVVARFAAQHGWVVDECAYNLLVGRWECEYMRNYAIPD